MTEMEDKPQLMGSLWYNVTISTATLYLTATNNSCGKHCMHEVNTSFICTTILQTIK